MISAEQRAEIRRLFYAEHWKVGTIASALSVHPDTVRRAIEAERFLSHLARPRPTKVDAFLPFIRETLATYGSCEVVYNLDGGGGYLDDVTGLPLSPVIPVYPPSSAWWSQFAIFITLTASIGTGADGFSKLLAQSQLNDIRTIVKTFKPVDYVCREIVVFLNVTHAGNYYDEGHSYDTGLLYDQPGTQVLERFRSFASST